jgi:ethanolaminephosphotransferase
MYPFKQFSLGELKAIKNNAHKAVGNPIFYIVFTFPYCELIQKYVPKSITPNLITWMGLFSILTSFTLTMIFDWSLTNPPRFLHLINAFSIFLYITTDSLDGIHARKSQQCSPIGKILDHFVDSCNMFYITVMLCSCLRTGYSSVFIFLSLCTISGFYIAELIEKFTGYLKFGSISGAS